MKFDYWTVFGLCAQALFMARFIVQWIASERAGRSVVPRAFWYLSLLGATGLLTYAVHQRDPVFILGQTTGSFIYVRNLMLLFREDRENADKERAEQEQEPPSETGSEAAATEEA